MMAKAWEIGGPLSIRVAHEPGGRSCLMFRFNVKSKNGVPEDPKVKADSRGGDAGGGNGG